MSSTTISTATLHHHTDVEEGMREGVSVVAPFRVYMKKCTEKRTGVSASIVEGHEVVTLPHDVTSLQRQQWKCS